MAALYNSEGNLFGSWNRGGSPFGGGSEGLRDAAGVGFALMLLLGVAAEEERDDVRYIESIEELISWLRTALFLGLS